jgi:pSer/pThr/pTyr-binding forkhead associated (FHA) protein
MASAMLFVPPHPPVALPGEGVVVIGRSRENALRLPDPDTSRKHAKILCEGGRYRIRDLASTNGTFVNGERIEQHDLAPGDRIRIGENQITFCRIGDLDLGSEDDDAQTLLFERPAATGDAFQGDLGEIPPFAVIQILEMGRKTGCLRLDSDGENGRLWFQDGAPVHAETKSQVGFDAAVSLVHASSGRFRFDALSEVPAVTIRASVTELLLEASRQLDEAGA